MAGTQDTDFVGSSTGRVARAYKILALGTTLSMGPQGSGYELTGRLLASNCILGGCGQRAFKMLALASKGILSELRATSVQDAGTGFERHTERVASDERSKCWHWLRKAYWAGDELYPRSPGAGRSQARAKSDS